jgi:peptide chain release factor subunit 1
MTAVAMHSLRDLASFRAVRGCAISLYVDLDPSQVPTAGALDTRLGSLIADGLRCYAVRRSELGHEQEQRLRSDVERIARFFDEEFERDGSRGVAIFDSSPDNLWQVLRLSQPVPDLLKIGRRLYLAPLVPLADERDVIVVSVGREQGQVWRLKDAKLELLADRFVEQPRRHDQGGWAQARFARHLERLVHEHLRDVAAELERYLRRSSYDGLVIVAGEDARPELEQLLSTEARRILIGWAQAPAHAGESELREAIRPLLERRRGERESELERRWRDELGRGGRACAGWERTLEAASDCRVETLLYRLGSEHVAWVCPGCERISAAPGNCPLDGDTMIEQADGLDLAVHRVLENGGSVTALRDPSTLSEGEEIGALLRY